MTTRQRRRAAGPARVLGPALALVCAAAPAEVVLHAGGALPGPAIEVPAAAGTATGTNLFHSFSVFNVLPGESVTFTGPGTVRNVVARVTGGTSAITGSKASTIDGPLTLAIRDASLYLFNPNGVAFGPSGAVSTTGSVYISTADYVRFADGATFNADPARTSTLSTAAPAAFGFLSPTPSPVTVAGSRLGPPDSAAPAAPGKTFALIGGGVVLGFGNFPDAAISVPDATVSLASVASAGEAVIRDTGTVDVSGFPVKGTVTLSPSARVSVGSSFEVRSGPGFVDVVPVDPTPPPAAAPAAPSPPPRAAAAPRPSGIAAPNPNAGSGLVALADDPLSAAGTVLPGCTGGGSGLSSIVEVGRGGAPADPDGYLPSSGAAPAPFRRGASGGSAAAARYDSFTLAKVSCAR
jgi:filamentous hemagglutinin family protein